MNAQDLERKLRPIKNAIANMLARAVVKLTDDTKKCQTAQVELGADGDGNPEIRADVERPQNYGFTSRPLDGAEAFVAFLGGKRDHGVVIAVEDRRYRVKSLEKGEVAIYTDQGDKIVLKRGGTIEATCSTKFKITAPLVETSADLKVNGKLDVTGKGTFTGTVEAATVIDGGVTLGTHTHKVGSLAGSSSCTAGGASVTVTGDTGAPN